MRVAIYSGTIPSTTFIENLIKGIAANDVEVLLFGSINKKTGDPIPNIHIHPTPKNRYLLLLSVFYQLIALLSTDRRAFVKLVKYMKKTGRITQVRLWGKYLPVVRHRPDIFHLQWAKGVEEWLFLKELFGVKLIVSFRGSHINYSPFCDNALAQSYRKSFPCYDAFHCVSQAIAVKGALFGAELKKSTVIYPAVDESLLHENRNENRNNRLEILSVGRDHWNKGYPVALDAMALLKKRGVAFHYTIVAGGEKEELKYQVSELALNDSVTLTDSLPHHEVLKLYSQSDLFLLPSFEEGVANVVLEAMALGTPVISTDCGGMREVIEDGVNGFLIPIRNPQTIQEAVERFMLTDDSVKTLMSRNAKKQVQEKHLLNIQIHQMIELYKNVIHA